MSYTLSEISEICGGSVVGDPGLRPASVSTDTRTLTTGALFVALTGESFDGHDYIDAARSAGAAAALVSRPGSDALPCIQVRDTLSALGDLARQRRMEFDGPVIAITGSNGKTTTKEMCAKILAAGGRRVRRTPGNLNNHIGLPLSILGLEEEDEVLVVELGMNHTGEIDHLAGICSPDVGAITQAASAHLGLLGSVEEVAKAKGELFDHLRRDGTAVINADDPHVCAQAGRFAGRHLSFGIEAKADFSAQLERSGAEGTVFMLSSPAGSERIQLPQPGRHLVVDALCAAAAAHASGALGAKSLPAIRRGLEAFEPLEGRLGLRSAAGGFKVLDDSYNANPHSVEAALRTLVTLTERAPGILVLGDMLELGPSAGELHAEVGRLAAELGVFAVIGVGELAAQMVAAAREAGTAEAIEATDTAHAAAEARRLAGTRGVILVKGSRSTRMDRVVDDLLENT